LIAKNKKKSEIFKAVKNAKSSCCLGCFSKISFSAGTSFCEKREGAITNFSLQQDAERESRDA